MPSSEPPESPPSAQGGDDGVPGIPPPPPPSPQVDEVEAEQAPPPIPADAADWSTAEVPDGPGPVPGPGRRRLMLWVLVAVLVIGVPVGLAIVAAVSAPAPGDEETTAPADAEEPDAPTDVEPEPPDLDTLSGRDAELAGFLHDVDESEQAMMSFQDRLGEALRDGGREPAELLAEVAEAAAEGAGALREVRPELVRPLDDRDFEEVRVAYLAHHDAWADYLDAVAEDPTVLGGEAEDSRWQLSINLSAEVFARELRGAVDDDLERSVRTYATDILRRGFEMPDRVPDA